MDQTEVNRRITQKLGERKDRHRFRTLNSVENKPSGSRLFINKTGFINFSSNDYLGLANDPDIIKRSQEFIARYGAGSSSSRLITGTLNIHTGLEEKLASLYQRDRVLLYNTGFQANSTILPAVTGKEDLILADRNCHNSILTGCRASRASWNRFRHNDLNHLESLLKKSRKQNIEHTWIVTESVFSMDGDMAPLPELISLSKKYKSKLYVDDAHAIGVFGETGLGLSENIAEIDLIVGTFGKAVGSFGAFAACSEPVADALINFSNGFIYTTALPPAVIGAVDAAYDKIPKMLAERKHLKDICDYARRSLQKEGYSTGNSSSQIIPVITGDDEKTLQITENLYHKGIFTSAIRPPTVPEGKSRIRLSLTADHTQKEIDLFIEGLNGK